MKIKHLEYFIAVADNGSFSKAAEKLYISQPALSKQIHLLEEELGIVLFQRSKRSVFLTSAGEECLKRARMLCEEYNDFISFTHTIREPDLPIFAIGYSGFMLQDIIPDLLKSLWERFPHTNITIRQENINILSNLLLKGKIDIALSNSSYLPDNPEIMFKKLSSIPYKLVLPQSHPLADGKRVYFEQIKDENFIMFSRNEYLNTYRENMEILRRHGVEPKTVYECSDPTTFYLMIEAGKGVAVTAIREEALKGYNVKLAELYCLPEDKPKDILAIWNKKNTSELIKEFLRIATDLLEKDS